MIGSLRGKLTLKQAPLVIVECAGVGYEVETPMSTFLELPPVGQPVFLQTHLVVRETAHSLFGFASEAEKALFRLLLGVSGVGAKMALAVLSTGRPPAMPEKVGCCDDGVRMRWRAPLAGR